MRYIPNHSSFKIDGTNHVVSLKLKPNVKVKREYFYSVLAGLTYLEKVFNVYKDECNFLDMTALGPTGFYKLVGKNGLIDFLIPYHCVKVSRLDKVELERILHALIIYLRLDDIFEASIGTEDNHPGNIQNQLAQTTSSNSPSLIQRCLNFLLRKKSTS